MRLLFIRHGDPDYEHDTLTAKGRVEAQALAEIIDQFQIDEAFQSPLGRARATAEYSLKKLGKEAITLDWLREFPAQVDPNVSTEARAAYATALKKDEITGEYQKRILWDMLPSYYGSRPELFDREDWRSAPLVKDSDMVPVYDRVIEQFDQLLADRGYRKNGMAYTVTENNDKTLAFFCHYGITSVLLSRLMNVSPFVPLQFMTTLPTSVTEVVTEERQKGIATFRTLRIGDISHLMQANEPASFSARFCERYENMDERH